MSAFGGKADIIGPFKMNGGFLMARALPSAGLLLLGLRVSVDSKVSQLREFSARLIGYYLRGQRAVCEATFNENQETWLAFNLLERVQRQHPVNYDRALSVETAGNYA